MAPLKTTIMVLLLTTLAGCGYQEPTNISPINNSGRLLFGDLTVGDENLPFAHLSSHAGHAKIHGGERVRAELTDLWSGENFILSSIVPACPSDDPYLTLLVELDGELNLRARWKSDSLDLESIHLKKFSDDFDCIPIVVRNEGNRNDFIIRVKQDVYSYALRSSDADLGQNQLHYGFLQTGKKFSNNRILISYNRDATLETTVLDIPLDKLPLRQANSAIYVHINQESTNAKVYLLNCPPSTPRQVAENLQIHSDLIHEEYIEINTLRIQKEYRRHDFRLPDLQELP